MRSVRSFVVALAALAAPVAAAQDLAGRGGQAWNQPAVTWSGIYVGLQTGFAAQKTASSTVHPSFTAASTNSSSEMILGLHAGANGQIGMFVFGGEADFERSGSAKAFRSAIAGGQYLGSVSSPWVATLRGRAGLAIDRFLVYGTAGMAVTEASYKGAATGLFSNTISSYFAGMVMGAGVEYAITNNILARVEYRYTDFAKKNFSFSGVDASNVDVSISALRVGASLKF